MTRVRLNVVAGTVAGRWLSILVSTEEARALLRASQARAFADMRVSSVEEAALALSAIADILGREVEPIWTGEQVPRVEDI